jgi:uncharacterized protein YjcR
VGIRDAGFRHPGGILHHQQTAKSDLANSSDSSMIRLIQAINKAAAARIRAVIRSSKIGEEKRSQEEKAICQ